MLDRPTPPRPKVALVLSGGGARAAYQAGVLRALVARLPAGARNPFAIVCGTSAGAINAAALAAGARRLAEATEGLEAMWTRLHVADVFRADGWSLLRRARRLLGSFLGGGRAASLLDNAPLGDLLRRAIRFEDIGESIEAGALDALAVTALDWRRGLSVSFCQTREAAAGVWERAQRLGVTARIGPEHLLASCAIPLVFPPAEVEGSWYGDGAVRQVAPTAPALHLGADRILVIGAHGARHVQEGPAAPPTTARVAGQILASMFTDALGTDMERVRLVNAAVRQIDPAALPRSPVPLRDVALLSVTPEASIETLAMRHLGELPRPMRVLLRGLGGKGPGGGGLASYLLFEPGYCRALVELGAADVARHGAELDAFLAPALRPS